MENSEISKDLLIQSGYMDVEPLKRFEKTLECGEKIIAFKEANGVILHLADSNGNILTGKKGSLVICPSKLLSEPDDIAKAEEELLDLYANLNS